MAQEIERHTAGFGGYAFVTEGFGLVHPSEVTAEPAPGLVRLFIRGSLTRELTIAHGEDILDILVNPEDYI